VSIDVGGATAAVLETWLDPPLQAYFRASTINWHAAIVDPVSKQLQAPRIGGGILFEWTNPPAQNDPQSVSAELVALGLYEVSLPLTMTGKVLLKATLFDEAGDVIDSNTTVIVVYSSGQ